MLSNFHVDSTPIMRNLKAEGAVQLHYCSKVRGSRAREGLPEPGRFSPDHEGPRAPAPEEGGAHRLWAVV